MSTENKDNSEIKYTKTGKVDKRSLNKGRYGAKGQGVSKTVNKGKPKAQKQAVPTEPTPIAATPTASIPPLRGAQGGVNNENPADQQNIINEIAKTGINPHPTMEPNTPNDTTPPNDIPAGDIINPEKLSDTIENPDYTPLNNKVNEKDYSNPLKGMGNPHQVIPEPVFVPPSLEEIQATISGANPATGAAAPNPNSNAPKKPVGTPMAESSGVNEVMRNNDLQDSAERRQGAEQLVDIALEAYDVINKVGAWAAKMNMEKLEIEQMEGKIDLGIELETATGSQTLKEFFEKYNHEVDKLMVVDEDFVTKVRPVMVRVFEKNGWGMSDEQYLLAMFGRDIAEKTAAVIGMKMSLNQTLKYIKAQYALKQRTETNIGTQPQQNFNTKPVQEFDNAPPAQPHYQQNPVAEPVQKPAHHQWPVNDFTTATAEDNTDNNNATPDIKNLEVYSDDARNQ